MNRLSTFVMCLAVYGCPVALAADPPVPPDSGKLPNSEPSNGAPRLDFSAPQLPGCWDNCCCPCDHNLIGGVGLYLIQPYFTKNPAFVIQSGGGGRIARPAAASAALDPPTPFTDHVNLGNHVEASPEVWLGYISDCGIGGRVRWWYFREGTSLSPALPPPPSDPTQATTAISAAPLGVGPLRADNVSGTALNVTSKLELQVWDLEALKTIEVCHLNLLFSGGVRLAHINQRYDAYSTVAPFERAGVGLPPVSGTESESLLSGHSFTGAGPIVGLEARYPCGCCGLGVYGLARGSVLFGSGRQTVAQAFAISGDLAQLAQSMGIPTSGTRAVATQHDDLVIPVAEFEVGAEYCHTVGHACLFGQLGLVGQIWWGAGNASNTDTAGPSSNQNLGLFGLAMRLGVNY